MTKQIRYFFFLCLIVLVASCRKKTPEDIGLPILPGDDLLNATFTDTLTLITHTVADDSLMTDEISTMLLGNINDPVFGVTKSSIFTQIGLSSLNPDFGTSPQLDSAVLSVVYSSGQYYGTLSPQKFKVYELAEPLYKDSSYFSNRMLQYATELGSAYVTPKPNVGDSVLVGSTWYPSHLRIALDKTFFGNFLNNPSAYSSNTAFLNYFKGVYIASSTGAPAGQGGIFYMNPTNIHPDHSILS